MRNFDQNMQRAMQLAQTAEGQQLIGTLRQIGGADLESAVGKAAAGDYSQIQQTLAKLMENPEAKKLLESMGW